MCRYRVNGMNSCSSSLLNWLIRAETLIPKTFYSQCAERQSRVFKAHYRPLSKSCEWWALVQACRHVGPLGDPSPICEPEGVDYSSSCNRDRRMHVPESFSMHIRILAYTVPWGFSFASTTHSTENFLLSRESNSQPPAWWASDQTTAPFTHQRNYF